MPAGSGFIPDIAIIVITAFIIFFVIILDGEVRARCRCDLLRVKSVADVQPLLLIFKVSDEMLLLILVPSRASLFASSHPFGFLGGVVFGYQID